MAAILTLFSDFCASFMVPGTLLAASSRWQRHIGQ
jgi:hypothetical protein